MFPRRQCRHQEPRSFSHDILNLILGYTTSNRGCALRFPPMGCKATTLATLYVYYYNKLRALPSVNSIPKVAAKHWMCAGNKGLGGQTEHHNHWSAKPTIVILPY